MSLQVVLIGDAARAEMRRIVEWIERRTDSARLQRGADAAAFRNQRDPQAYPDLIVVLEGHPDEFTLADVATLFALAPSGRIICCAGAWSESAGRNRKIWPLAVRVAAVSAIARLEQEWGLLTGEQQCVALLPTGSREERFAALHPPLSDSAIPLCVAVESPDAAYRLMLCELLNTAGATVVECSTAELLLWDIDPWSPDRNQELRRLIGAVEGRQIVALSGWLTPDLERELLAHGIRAVVPKLGDIHAVLNALQQTILP